MAGVYIEPLPSPTPRLPAYTASCERSVVMLTVKFSSLCPILLSILVNFLPLNIAGPHPVTADYYTQDKWEICVDADNPRTVFCRGHLQGVNNDLTVSDDDWCVCIVSSNQIITEHMLRPRQDYCHPRNTAVCPETCRSEVWHLPSILHIADFCY